MERDKAIDVIKKLLRLQESPNENEAALAAAKASELLLKYNLEMKDVSDTDDAEMVHVTANYTMPAYYGWAVRLMACIARNNFCKAYTARAWCEPVKRKHSFKAERTVGLHYRVTFYGRKTNAEIAAYMFDQLVLKLEEMVYERVRVCNLSNYKAYRSSWLAGAVITISDKLYEMRKGAQQQSSECSAIILLRDEEVEKAFTVYSDEVGMHKRKGAMPTRHALGFLQGRDDAKNIDINSGLKG